MELKSGEIYFVRERTGDSFGPFVKIGLVHGYRDSLTRLKEHQTGNPRSLFIDENLLVKTGAVDRVEAQLHKIFAPKRVSGEWFELPSDKEIQEAVSKAKELAEEVNRLMPVFSAADELALKPSNETQISASEDALALSTDIARAKGEIAVCNDLEAVISQKFKEAMADEKGVVGGAAEVVTVNYKPKFMEDAFKANNPELYAKYLDSVQSWKKTFTPKAKKQVRESLEQDFLDEVSRIEKLMGAVTSVEEAYLLNEPQLLVTNLKALSSWTEETSIAKLKVLCGTNAGIEGVCTWIRKFGDPKSVFNEQKFVEENPEIYLDFLAEAKTGTYIRVAKRKA